MSDDENKKTVPPWHWSVVPGAQWTSYYRMKKREESRGRHSDRFEGRSYPDPRDVDPPSGFKD